MREILFRAKDLQDKWLYGDLRHHKNDTCIFEAGGTKGEQIDQQTIGMGTGVLDKEGTEIFEGDVVQNGEGGYFYVVYWWDEDAAFRGKQVGSSSTIGLNYWRKELRIVGNIYDNPELMQYKPAPPPTPQGCHGLAGIGKRTTNFTN